MKAEILAAELKAKAGLGTLFQLILLCSLLTNIAMAVGFATMEKSVRTELVPPEIRKGFWVDGKTLSPEYLEEMGTWLIQQYATVSPGTVDMQSQRILKHVHPSVHGELSKAFAASSQKIKQENSSRVFWPKEVRIDKEGQRMALIGVLDTWISDKKVDKSVMKAYVIGFVYRDGYVTLKELREADNENDPFAPARTN